MKKIVLTFGLISGAIAAVMMLVTVPFIDRIPFEYLDRPRLHDIRHLFPDGVLRIRSYRENVGGGTITFGRAFKVGILITLISCVIYVIHGSSSITISCRTFSRSTATTWLKSSGPPARRRNS